MKFFLSAVWNFNYLFLSNIHFCLYMWSDESEHNQVDVLNFLVNDFCLFVTYSGHSVGWLPPYELKKVKNNTSFRSSNQSNAMFQAQVLYKIQHIKFSKKLLDYYCEHKLIQMARKICQCARLVKVLPPSGQYLNWPLR